jgi:NAD kinase
MPSLGNQHSLVGITYFSAIQEYLSTENPDKIIRHKLYIRCLEATGVKVVLGRFKAKSVYCHKCRQNIQKHEEKETDVSIAVKILDSFIKDECDLAVVVTGDTDLTPVIQVAKECYPKKEIIFLFPFNRENREMAKLAPNSFSIKRKSYRKHQFSNPFILPDKTTIFKPSNW